MVVANQTRAWVKALRKMLPQGIAWTREADTNMARLLTAIADEMANIEMRAVELLDEADPRTAVEGLPDWERITGFPDECVGELITLASRRRAVLARLGQIGGQSPQFFVDLAAVLGFTVTVTEFPIALCGIAECGDAMNGTPWIHWWQIDAPADTVEYADCGSAVCGDAIATWGNTMLECAIARAKPAHTSLIFSYT